MGAIARNIANNITTSGVFTSSAITNSSVTGITVLANASDGITLISSQTASNSASISFTSGLTSTYKAYKFVFSNIHPRTDSAYFQFNLSTDSGSNYNVAKTNTLLVAYHDEIDANTGFIYADGDEFSQHTGFIHLCTAQGNGADESSSGTLTLFNPSSTTYVKHWIFNNTYVGAGDACMEGFYAGYFNTTTAINAIRFKFSSGNMDGTILMYGIV